MSFKRLPTALVLTQVTFLLSLLLVLCGVASAATQGYKCIDAQGQVTYTELAIQGADCKPLGKAPKVSTDPEAAMEKLRNQVEAIDAANVENDNTETAASKRKQNCELSQKNLELLEGSGDILTTDADGNKRLMSAEERASSLQKTRQDIAYWCSE